MKNLDGGFWSERLLFYFLNHMAQLNLFNVVSSIILKFLDDDLQFPAVVFSFWKYSNVNSNYSNYHILIINYYYKNNYKMSQ